MKTSAAQNHEVCLVTVSPIEPGDAFNEYSNTLRNQIAQRAYEIFETRGKRHGHDVEDWLHAENEVLHSVPTSVRDAGHLLEVRADISDFQAGELDVRVEPFRIWITGAKNFQGGDTRPMFHPVELPHEIETSTALAALENGVLTISLRKVFHTVLEFPAKFASSKKKTREFKTRAAQLREHADIAKRYAGAAKDHLHRVARHLEKARALAVSEQQKLAERSQYIGAEITTREIPVQTASCEREKGSQGPR